MTGEKQPSAPLYSKPELMSPAGYWPQLQTAIESGADAVYFGLNHFSARAKVGFGIDELPEVMETLHARGVKGFVTFNTLVFDHELKQAQRAIEAIASNGVDAVIVQDVGIVTLIRQVAPELEIHGSTQMSITSAQGADFAADLGCSRVVLGRELGMKDIRKIAETTNVELEVFVHGALCVSYSGQCFSSEAWGGRSANRGKCAQACRLSYDLIVDGEARDLGEYRYLLSPGDLCAIEQIPELMEIGIACVKIEGRYKDKNYVAVTTRAYRDAIDLAAMKVTDAIDEDQKRDLEQIYSRGLGPHFIAGTNHQTAVEGRAPRHRGICVGTVIEVRNKSVVVEVTATISRGDGLVFDAANWRSPDEPEEGGHVYEVKPIRSSVERQGIGENEDAGLLQLEFGYDDIEFGRIRAGDLVWRTHDPKLIKRLKPLTRNEVPVFTQPLNWAITANLGSPLKVVASLANGLAETYLHDEPLAAANKRALDEATVSEKLGRLGGTPYHLGQLTFETTGNAFVPTSLLNQIRRDLVDQLFEKSGQLRPIAAKPVLDESLSHFRPASLIREEPTTRTSNQPELHLLVRSPDQLDAALAWQADQPKTNASQTETTRQISSITLDYLELYGLRPAVEKIRASGLRPRVASPRILKPAEQNVKRFLLSLECDIVVRSSGLLNDLLQEERAEDVQLIGDFSLNVANSLTAFRYLDQGLDQITPTYDLNSAQIDELLKHVPAERVEVICYSHLPVFHTEHCVFCRFLSDGTDNTNCGHPCETHRVSVRDSQGRAHPVMADVGCRNTVFGAEAQTDPQAIGHWIRNGFHAFRVELVHQDSEQTKNLIDAFMDYFAQAPRDESLLRQRLQQASTQGTTQGSLFVPEGYQDLIQLE